MRKLKLDIFNRLSQHKLSRIDFSLLIHLSLYQDDQGYISGVYNKEVCEALECSYQAFYDSMHKIEKLGLIRINKWNRYDMDAVILGNSFEGEYQEGYMNMSYPIYRNKEFYHMRAGAQLLAMMVMQFCDINNRSYQIGIKKFYKKYKERLQVERRVIRGYLEELKAFFSVGEKDGKLFIAPLKRALYASERAADQMVLNDHKVKTECRRNRMKQVDPKAVKDTAELFVQYKRQIRNYNETHDYNPITPALVIRRSLEIMNAAIKKMSRWKRELRPKLIHQELRRLLGLTQSQMVGEF